MRRQTDTKKREKTDRIAEVRLAVENSKETIRQTRQTMSEVLLSQSEFAVNLVKQADTFYKFDTDDLGDRCKTLAAMVYKVVSEAIPKNAFSSEELERLTINLQKVSTALKSK